MIVPMSRTLAVVAIALAAVPLISGLAAPVRGQDVVTVPDLLSPLPSLDLPLPSEDLLSPLPSLDLGTPLPTLDLGSPLPSAPTGVLPTQEPSGLAVPSVQGGGEPPSSSPTGGVGSPVTGSRAIVPEAPPLATVLPGDSLLVPALGVAVPVLIVGALVMLQVLGGAAALRVARGALDRLAVAAPAWLRQDGPTR